MRPRKSLGKWREGPRRSIRSIFRSRWRGVLYSHSTSQNSGTGCFSRTVGVYRGTWDMIHGTRYTEHDIRNMIHDGTRYTEHGTQDSHGRSSAQACTRNQFSEPIFERAMNELMRDVVGNSTRDLGVSRRRIAKRMHVLLPWSGLTTQTPSYLGFERRTLACSIDSVVVA